MTKTNWEEDFDNTNFAKKGGVCFECCDYEMMYNELKFFISSLLSQRDEEWREKITKWAIGRLPAFPPKAIIKDFEELKLISVKDIEEFLTQSHLLNKEPISISERLVWEDIKKLNENAEELKKLKSQVK